MSQMDWTKTQLLTFGKVSRNEALKMFFTRLGSRINDLNNEGWVIKGKIEETEFGKDYVYRLISFPVKSEGVQILKFNQGALKF